MSIRHWRQSGAGGAKSPHASHLAGDFIRPALLHCSSAPWPSDKSLFVAEGRKTRGEDGGSSRYYLTHAKSIRADGEAERRTSTVFFPPCTSIKREK